MKVDLNKVHHKRLQVILNRVLYDHDVSNAKAAKITSINISKLYRFRRNKAHLHLQEAQRVVELVNRLESNND